MIVTPSPGGCTVCVRIHPGAKRNAITGTHAGALKISLTTPPTDGRTNAGVPGGPTGPLGWNAALVAFLAERLAIPRASIDILTGAATRSKTLRLTGITAAEAESRLLTHLA
jgi:hypothetical protein